ADEPGSEAIGTRRTLLIEHVLPEIDGGRHPVKRIVGDSLRVTADILGDGHDMLDSALLLRADDEDAWREAPMRLVDNDRWAGEIPLERNRWHRYTIEAWRDEWGTWRDGLLKKVEAKVAVPSELAEGRLMLEAAARRAGDADATAIRAVLRALDAARDEPGAVAAIAAEEVLAVMRRNPDRRAATRYRELELVVDRTAAGYAAWYELFPRSQGRNPGKASTLKEAEWRLPDIARMGFNVVYLPPIHPIGRTNRKGRNNSLDPAPDDVGSPYAIGSTDGGHDAVAPELGGLAEFEHFRMAVEKHGMELAIDLALQASPDHPWVQDHPGWFRHAPDGTIKYAENPPKKYQDIYPIDFSGDDPEARAALWAEVRRIVLLWVERGVKTFRVDNPHTKPLPFWSWLIREVQREHPEVVFLSEAFTRPKMMRALAKIGFTQSYTYFTWRESRDALRDYFTELTRSEMREYFRGNLFTNTPDINPHHLDAGRPAFVIRSVLAATLSSLWGVYSGWELAENARLEDREEYLDSEKYEIRVRDWDAPGNVKPLITSLNRLRAEHRALQLYDNLRFQDVTAERTLFYRKALPAGTIEPLSGEPGAWRDAVYVAVNVDPAVRERAILHPNLPETGIGWDEPYRLTDLLSGESRLERGADVVVDLDPAGTPFLIFSIAPVEA
ncbi:MAG TPA: alpha-1,4-glucan--maltose-1-phosphate maltosyltransferase, partial [Candidatus Limnocylindria bacterium]|nr:alpha-1,4-glucan--maltose-1-phosphate maltosyltransferase [Candidatus Limnocylindria bacterium]